MSVIVQSPWTRQPQVSWRVNQGNPLTRGVTHLYTPSLGVNVVTGESARIVSGGISLTNRRIGRVTSSNNIYFSESVSRINAGNPWTLAALMRVDPNINGVNSWFITTVDDASNPSSFDRSIGFTYNAPHIYLRGSLYDGANQFVDHETPIAYASGEVIFTAVVSCSNGVLRAFLNGVKAASDTTASNNGWTGYSAAQFVIGKTGTGYEYGLVSRFDGVAWLNTQAQEFHRNPWQLFAERPIWVPTIPNTPRLTSLAPTSGNKPRYTVTY